MPTTAKSGAPRITLVAAMTRNRVIGRDGGMPWHLPADLAHFKEVTMNHPVVMGRRTFDSIGRALPGRRNIVVTRGRPELPDGVERAGSVDDALAMADAGDVMVIGGGQIYADVMPRATHMELTLVDCDESGDTEFPEFDLDEWVVESTRVRRVDERNPCRLVFTRLRRVDAGGGQGDDD